MNKLPEIANTVWYIVLSLVAAIITIFVFITGKNLPDLFITSDSATNTPINANIPVDEIATVPSGSVGVLAARRPTLNEIRAENPGK